MLGDSTFLISMPIPCIAVHHWALLAIYQTEILFHYFNSPDSLPAMSFGIIGGGGWVHPKGANSMAASGLVSRNDLVGTGKAISVLFGIMGVRNKQSNLV